MKKLLTILTLSFIFTASAQTGVKEKTEPAYIEVTGTAEMKVVPDIIYISVYLKEKVVNRDTYTIAQQEAKLKQIVQLLNLGAENLSLSDASTDIIKYKNKEKGVEEAKTYLLKVSTAQQASAVFKGLHDNNIKEADITGTDHSKIDELRKQVRIDAIKAAKDKAIYLLAAIGEEPGSPLVITENPASGKSRQNFSSNVYTPYDKDGATENLDADFTKIIITFSYYVKYAIK